MRQLQVPPAVTSVDLSSLGCKYSFLGLQAFSTLCQSVDFVNILKFCLRQNLSPRATGFDDPKGLGKSTAGSKNCFRFLFIRAIFAFVGFVSALGRPHRKTAGTRRTNAALWRARQALRERQIQAQGRDLAAEVSSRALSRRALRTGSR